MKTAEIKELVQTNADLRTELESYIDSYVGWVEKHAPAGSEHAFGVGITSDNRYGTYYGFFNDELGRYTCTGKGWCVGNDFQCRILGSNTNQMRRFAKKIPALLKNGFDFISRENTELAEILSKKVAFED